MTDNSKHLHRFEDHKQGFNYSYEEPVQEIIRISKNSYFNDTKFMILYRDPVARYKSGLQMIATNPWIDEYTDPDEVLAELKKSMHILALKLNCGIYPQFDFYDNHCSPVLHISLLLYLCRPNNAQFMHLADLNKHISEELLPLLSQEAIEELNRDYIHHRITKKNEVACKVGSVLFEQLQKSCLYVFDDSVPDAYAHPVYNFKTWIAPDQIAYNYLSSTNNVDVFGVTRAYLEGLDILNCVSRNRAMLASYAHAIPVLPAKCSAKTKLKVDNFIHELGEVILSRSYKTNQI